MGTKIVARGSVAPWNSSVLPPVANGLEAWFTFDTAANRLGLNRALGKAPAKVLGEPTMFPGYARFKGMKNYIETDMSESTELTYFILGRAVLPSPAVSENDNKPFFMGNYDSPSAQPELWPSTVYGASLYVNSPSSISSTGTRFTDATNTAITSSPSSVNGGPSETLWAIYSVSISVAGGTVLTNHTTGVSVTGVNKQGRITGSRKIRIGSAYRGFDAETDISFAAGYSRALSTDEKNQIVDIIRKRASRLGIAA